MQLINITKKSKEIYINKYSYFMEITFKYDPAKTEKDYLKEYKKYFELYLNFKLPRYSQNILFNKQIKNDQIILNIKTIF